MIFDGDEVVFNSGRRRYANGQVIGLGEKGILSEGYDGLFFRSLADEEELHEKEDRLTYGDVIELCDFMLERWVQYKRRIVGYHDA